MTPPERSKRRQEPRGAVTIQDVARQAGVSTATVSRALARPDVVTAATRDRVLQAVAETGYTPNVAARHLRARRAMLVLVVVPNVVNPFFPVVLRGIDDELVAAGYDMIIGNLDNKAEREARYVDLAMAGQVDGVILLNGRIPRGRGRTMADAGLPMASIAAAIPDLDGTQIVVDDHKASRRVAEHLLALGHRHFGYLAGPRDNWHEIERFAGFRDGLAAAGIAADDVVYVPGDYNLEAGVTAAEAFLALERRPTAVYATSDEMAVSFMKTVRTAGVAVPDALSIVGFDGIEVADFVDPTLTTVRQPRHAMGRAGARALLDIIAGAKPGRQIEMQAPLMVRDSTAAAPSRS